MRRFGLGVAAIAALGLCVPALAEDITSLQLAPLFTDYTVADLQLQIYNDETGMPPLAITINFDVGDPVTNTPGLETTSFYMNGFLYQDLSEGGVAWGRFNNGIVDFFFEDLAANVYHLAGDLIAFQIIETSPNLFDGSGQFEVDVCETPGGCQFPAEIGSIASFTLVPDGEWGDITGFDSDFGGMSVATLVPDGSGFPEPATCIVLGGLAIGLLRRRR